MSSSKVVPSDHRMTTESVESSVRQKIRKKSVHYDASMNKKRSRKESLSMKSPLTRENRFGFIDCEEGNSTLDSMEEKYVVNSVIPTADIESIISQSLESHFLFAEFTSKAIKRFISKMKCERFDPGVNICQQGQYGQKFYIVAKGSVEIIKNGVTAETINVGGNFGDVALLHRCARVYTAISIGNVELWSIQSKPFREILKQNQSTKLSQIGDFLRKNKLFTSLNENQIAIAAEAFVLQTFSNGTLIIQEGDSDVDVFYVLISGKVRVTQQDRFVRDMSPGVVFGARSLIQKESRTATCRAVGKVECYRAQYIY